MRRNKKLSKLRRVYTKFTDIDLSYLGSETMKIDGEAPPYKEHRDQGHVFHSSLSENEMTLHNFYDPL